MSGAEVAEGVGRSLPTGARLAIGAALGLLSGVLAVLAAPAQGFGWLVLVAGVPMLVATFHVLPAHLAGVGTAIPYGIAAWGTAAVLYGDAYRAGRGAAIAGCVVFGLVAGVSGWLQRVVWDAVGYRWWVAFQPLAWGVQAVVRLHLPNAGSDAFLALDLFRHPAVIQPVGLAGIVGLEMAIVFVNVVFAALVMTGLQHPDFPWGRTRRLLAGLVASTAAWMAVSLALLEDRAASVRVAAVQPGPSWFNYSPESGDNQLGPLAELTREAVDRGAELVVWPEYGLPADPCPAGEGSRTGALADLARDEGVYIVAGYGAVGAPGGDSVDSPLGGADFVARNEAVLVTPEGECLGPYAKQHPVELAGERSDTDYGTPTFASDLGRLAMVICYDLDFTDVSRAMAADGARLLAAPSDDWAAMAEYHVAPPVFRAVENGVAVVKADKTYDSAVIDPDGRIVAQVIDPEGRQAVLVSDVALGSGERTIWNRFAPMIESAYLVAAAAVGLLLARDAIRARRMR